LISDGLFVVLKLKSDVGLGKILPGGGMSSELVKLGVVWELDSSFLQE
jgi:hypothetical protein